MSQGEVDLQNTLDKIQKVFFIFPPLPFLLLISPAMNSWVRTCISEGSLGAKLGDGLHSPGPGMAGVNQWAVREHSVFYFYLFFLLNGVSACLWSGAWMGEFLGVVPPCWSGSCQGPVVGAELCWTGILGEQGQDRVFLLCLGWLAQQGPAWLGTMELGSAWVWLIHHQEFSAVTFVSVREQF